MASYESLPEKTQMLLKWIGVGVRKRRKEKGMTRRQLAEKAGLSEPEIALIEQGKQNFNFHTGHQVAEALGTIFPLIEIEAYVAGGIPLQTGTPVGWPETGLPC